MKIFFSTVQYWQGFKLVFNSYAPWDFSIKEFEFKSKYWCRLEEEENSKESNLRFGAFKNGMEKKHIEFGLNLKRWSQKLVNPIRGYKFMTSFRLNGGLTKVPGLS